jgi:A/G-specific adenine glycosylase
MMKSPRTLEHYLNAFSEARNRHGTGPMTIARFRDLVWFYYRTRGRSLPWRRTRSHYQVYVSEVMLQQTQVDRVARMFPRFIAAFPAFDSLTHASLRDVLAAWQGMGYNRRALNLKRAAEIIVSQHDGALPRDTAALARLPGIGKATAASIAAFAFNQPTVFIETNIRSTFIHCFFPAREEVADAELLPLVATALDPSAPRRWYNALMDFGAWLKSRHPNPSRRSRHHRGQPAFAGSDRQLRGALLRVLTARGALTMEELRQHVPVDYARLEQIAAALAHEGFVTYNLDKWSLSD